ncbi:DUF6273 domain-containing protein, partial [Blautia sp. JLR.GB0024]|uniref:DUF6273 domain-containing protein n=1 Tax=Blautia sp. JLR.GB0024 TaxID=3123295 RepID=UPI003003BE96
DVSGCSNLEHVYFDGTGITGLLLPVGGILKTLHLPATITNLTIRNQTSLQDLSIPSYAGISTLRLENVSSAVDSRAILEAIPANSRVRLIGINWAAGTADKLMEIIGLLDTMRGLDEAGNNTDMAQVSGTISVDTVTGAQLAEIAGKYPDIKVAYQHITSNLYFYNDDGSKLLYTQAIVDGGDGTYSGSTPTKASTAQYTYSHVGWSKKPGGAADSTALKAVTADRSVYAAFTATVRRYTVKFYNGSTLLQTVSNVAYGGSATYTGTTPVSPEDSSLAFLGWQPTGKNITGNTSCYAQFESAVEVKEITDSWDVIIANIDNGTYKSKYKIGNYKPLDLGSEGVINMQMAGFELDEMSDGSGMAPITWIGKELLITERRMNSRLITNADGTCQEGTGAIGGWEKCEMRTKLNVEVLPLAPEIVINRIARVIKTQKSIDKTGANYNQTTHDALWIPDVKDMGYPKAKYGRLYSDKTSMLKCRINAEGTVNDWWLRGTAKDKDTYNYMSDSINMDIGNSGANIGGERGVCLCFCLRGPREITDTWEEIFAAEADGTYKEKYQISDYKPLDLGSEGIINMQIAGFDVDDLADGTGKAPITWIGKELLKTERRMNLPLVTNEDGTYQEGTGSIGGWGKCELRAWINETLKAAIPESVRNNLVEVINTQREYNASGNMLIQTSNDYLWIPKENEIINRAGLYAQLFPNDESRKKSRFGRTSSDYWHTRDITNSGCEYFGFISDEGNSSGRYYRENGVCLCFCT